MSPWDFALQPGPPESAVYWKTELKTSHPWGLGWSDGGAWAWETETWMQMSVPLSIDCGILKKPGPGQEWIWRCLGLFSPSEIIHRLANTFSYHLRKCLQDHYDGRNSCKCGLTPGCPTKTPGAAWNSKKSVLFWNANSTSLRIPSRTTSILQAGRTRSGWELGPPLAGLCTEKWGSLWQQRNPEEQLVNCFFQASNIIPVHSFLLTLLSSLETYHFSSELTDNS